jgi:hypothetical protein
MRPKKNHQDELIHICPACGDEMGEHHDIFVSIPTLVCKTCDYIIADY